MGAAALTVRTASTWPLGLAIVVGLAGVARAEPVCTGGPVDDPFATCFDPGNRMVISAEVAGGEGDAAAALSVGMAVRHVVTTDDPGVWWRLEHEAFITRMARDTTRVTGYRGRYIRHSRDGYIVLPTSPPRKLFLPFDVGAEADVGDFAFVDTDETLDLGVVRTALFLEVLRSPSFRRRIQVGATGRWDLTGSTADDLDVTEHHVAPFSLAMVAGHFESERGTTILDLRAEAGRSWSTVDGWHTQASVAASLERVLIAVNDAPLSLYAETGYTDPGRGAYAVAGLRLGLLTSHRAPR